MSRLSKRRLGGTSLSLSTLGFGGAPLGGFRSDADDDQSDATLTMALNCGINYFDTAPLYGYGRSEHRLGQVLRRVPRGAYAISSKVGRYLRSIKPGEDTKDLMQGGLPFRPVFDYTYDGVMRSFEQTVHRLGIGQIDLMLIHDVDPAGQGGDYAAQCRFEECLEGAIPALTELKRAGDIKAFGVGMGDNKWCLRFLRAADIDCVMTAGRYSLVDQSAIEELLPECALRGVSVLMAGPFNSGILATGSKPGALYRYRAAPPEILQKVTAIKAVCDTHNVNIMAAALRFPLGHYAVCSVVAGADAPEMVRLNTALMDTQIPDQLWIDLKSKSLLDHRCPTAELSSTLVETDERGLN